MQVIRARLKSNRFFEFANLPITGQQEHWKFSVFWSAYLRDLTANGRQNVFDGHAGGRRGEDTAGDDGVW